MLSLGILVRNLLFLLFLVSTVLMVVLGLTCKICVCLYV